MNAQCIDMKAAAQRARFRLVDQLVHTMAGAASIVGPVEISPTGWDAVVSTELGALRICYAHRHRSVAMLRVTAGWHVTVC